MKKALCLGGCGRLIKTGGTTGRCRDCWKVWVSESDDQGPTSQAVARLREWVDLGDTVASVRHHEPIYPNPAALRRDVRQLLRSFP